MDKVIAEVVIGALVISLMFFVIPIFRSNSELISNMAGKADYSEKIKEVMLPDLQDNSNCFGSDVIAVIRYYALKGGAVIKVCDGEQGSYIFIGDIYDEYTYKIEPDKKFAVNIIIEEDKPVQFEFIAAN